jgi:hypothetical protein
MLRGTERGVTLAVRAQPGAKKTAVIGVYGELSRSKVFLIRGVSLGLVEALVKEWIK